MNAAEHKEAARFLIALAEGAPLLQRGDAIRLAELAAHHEHEAEAKARDAFEIAPAPVCYCHGGACAACRERDDRTAPGNDAIVS